MSSISIVFFKRVIYTFRIRELNALKVGNFEENRASPYFVRQSRVFFKAFENKIKLKVPIKNATHYRMSSISIVFFKRVIYTFNAFKDYFMFSIAVIIS